MAKDLSDSLDDLTRAVKNSSYVPYEYPEPRQLPPIPPRHGSAERQKATGASGIASPLDEPMFSARTYWPDAVWRTTDGLFYFTYAPLKSITLRDSGNNEVVINFAAPPT